MTTKRRGCFLAVCMMFVFLFSGLLSAAETQGDSGKKPLIHAPITLKEFDSVPEGTTVEYGFVVQNKGDADLNIANVRTE